MNRPKQLTNSAKAIFSNIISQRNGEGYVKLNNDASYMPLTVETISAEMKTVLGTGVIISLCHYYEQNGDLMQDPEVTFFVVDNRGEDKTNMDMLGVWAMTYQNAGLGKYNEYVKINETGGMSFNAYWQNDLTIFCNQWMKNIKDQQGLKVTPAKRNVNKYNAAFKYIAKCGFKTISEFEAGATDVQKNMLNTILI